MIQRMRAHSSCKGKRFGIPAHRKVRSAPNGPEAANGQNTTVHHRPRNVLHIMQVPRKMYARPSAHDTRPPAGGTTAPATTTHLAIYCCIHQHSQNNRSCRCRSICFSHTYHNIGGTEEYLIPVYLLGSSGSWSAIQPSTVGVSVRLRQIYRGDKAKRVVSACTAFGCAHICTYLSRRQAVVYRGQRQYAPVVVIGGQKQYFAAKGASGGYLKEPGALSSSLALW